MKRDAREEIAERVLERETDDRAQHSRRGEERAESDVGVKRFEDNHETGEVSHYREDIANQCRGFVASAQAKEGAEDNGGEGAHDGNRQDHPENDLDDLYHHLESSLRDSHFGWLRPHHEVLSECWLERVQEIEHQRNKDCGEEEKEQAIF